MRRRLLNLLTLLSLLAFASVIWLWAVSHIAGPGYAAMSYDDDARFRPPRDTGFRFEPGSFSVMADQRRGAPPPWGPIPFWPLALMSAALPARAGVL
jgi:hypothetical protein